MIFPFVCINRLEGKRYKNNQHRFSAKEAYCSYAARSNSLNNQSIAPKSTQEAAVYTDGGTLAKYLMIAFFSDRLGVIVGLASGELVIGLVTLPDSIHAVIAERS